MAIQHRWWIDVFDEAAEEGEMSQFTFIEISRFHNLGVIIFCASPKFKENEWMLFHFTCYKLSFQNNVFFSSQQLPTTKLLKLRSSNSPNGGFWQRNCCINFSTVSSLLGSNVPCNKAIRNINVPTSDPGSRNFRRRRKANICHPPNRLVGKKKTWKMDACSICCLFCSILSVRPVLCLQYKGVVIATQR